MSDRLPFLIWCVAFGIVAYVCLDLWQTRNAPLYRSLERQWYADVQQLEASKRLPGPWYDVRSLEIYGGTPESKDWLRRIHVPIKTRPDGHYKMEVLLVEWEEEGKRGALVQYNLVDLQSNNNIWELGRTYILAQPHGSRTAWQVLWDDLHR